MTVPIPDEARRKRIALIASVATAAVLLTAAGVTLALMARKPKPPVQRTYTPAKETTAASDVPSSSMTSTGSTVASSALPSAGAVPGSAGSGSTAIAPRVAFRLDSWVNVADEGGANATPVIQSQSGPFSLSPDGNTLALVDGGQLVLADVNTGRADYAGSAEPILPVWLPDSSAVLFVRFAGTGVPQVWRVPRSGRGEVVLGDGSGAAVSSDGKVIALLPAQGGTGDPSVSVSQKGGPFKRVKLSGGEPTALAVAPNRVYVGTLSSSGRSGIWSLSLDGKDARPLIRPAAGDDKGMTYGRLLLSADNAKLLYTVESDDGYSRMWVIPAAGGTEVRLSPRRDDYPLRWSSDGARVFFIEGNAIQGESTVLGRTGADGGGRVVLVDGASQ